jgi:hypothetical protein
MSASFLSRAVHVLQDLQSTGPACPLLAFLDFLVATSDTPLSPARYHSCRFSPNDWQLGSALST